MVVKERLIRVVSVGSGKDEIPFFFLKHVGLRLSFATLKKKRLRDKWAL